MGTGHIKTRANFNKYKTPFTHVKSTHEILMIRGNLCEHFKKLALYVFRKPQLFLGYLCSNRIVRKKSRKRGGKLRRRKIYRKVTIQLKYL